MKAPLGSNMLVEDATGEARVRPDTQSLDGDFLERHGIDPDAVGVSVQAVVAWAMQFRPDIIASVTKDQLGEAACPQGFDLSTCTSCSGRGVVCGKKGSAA